MDLDPQHFNTIGGINILVDQDFYPPLHKVQHYPRVEQYVIWRTWCNRGLTQDQMADQI